MRAEGLGISNLRPANLLTKTHAAERLVNDKRVPDENKKLALEAMRDEDRYRQLLYEDNRFSLFVLGQTIQVLRERFEEEGISADAPYAYIHVAIERNVYSEVELRNAAAEAQSLIARNQGAVTEAPSP